MSDHALMSMPKVELHCHLELAFRKKTLQQWAVDLGMAVGNKTILTKPFLSRSRWTICHPCCTSS